MRAVVQILLWMLIPALAVAGGWTQQTDHGYFKLGGRLLRAPQRYDSTGTPVNIPTYGDFTASIYGEYGFTSWLTGVASVPVVKRVTINRQVSNRTGLELAPGHERTDIGDINLGARFGILQEGSTVLAAQLTLGLPTGNATATDGTVTGDGEFNQSLSLQAGHSFYPAPLYAAADVGVNHRTEGFAEQWTFGAELGWNVLNNLLLIGRVQGVGSLGDNAASTEPSIAFASNQRYLSYGAEANLQLTESAGIAIGVESATWARNTLAAPIFSASIFLKL
ncbi:MAG: hypothetical protein IPM61_07360 [Chlorobi bacterium]|nr:MAG: hypothetical protein UZ07_CHB004003351 [Chlorobi bacterium OLB7]MBK8911133.1 hypothetical protein [Chlorobiota bacterium]